MKIPVNPLARKSARIRQQQRATRRKQRRRQRREKTRRRRDRRALPGTRLRDFRFNCTSLSCVVVTRMIHHGLISVCLSQRLPCHRKSCVFCGPVNICLIDRSNHLVYSIFSVCSKRFFLSFMMSVTSCNLLLVFFGASSSTVRFQPLGVLSNGITLPVSIF